MIKKSTVAMENTRPPSRVCIAPDSIYKSPPFMLPGIDESLIPPQTPLTLLLSDGRVKKLALNSSSHCH